MSEAKGIIGLQKYSEFRMLFNLAYPVILSLLVQGLYSIVDSLYLSRLGEEALSAISIAFVIQSLSVGFFIGTASGMNVLISRAFGAGKYDKAKSAVVNGILVQAIISTMFMIFGIWGVPFYFQKTTNISSVIEYGIKYLTPCMLFVFASSGQITFERLLQSTGITKYVLIAQGIGSVINIVLDPIMIFGFSGFPAMGMAGAAYATIIGQIVALGVAIIFNVNKNRLIFNGIGLKMINRTVALSICKIVIPLAATSIASNFGNYFINRILIWFSTASNAAFGIYAKLQSVALMPAQGFCAALVTMYAFFLGKRDNERIKKTLINGEIVVGGWNVLCFLFFFTLPVLALKMFNASSEMFDVGIHCFRIIGLTYLTSGLMTGLTAFFQSIGKSVYTLILSLSRQVLVRVPVAFFLLHLETSIIYGGVGQFLK